MLFKQLRHRLAASTFLLIVGTAAAMVMGVHFAFEYADDNFIDGHLEREVDSLMTIFASAPALAELPNENFAIFVARNGNTNDLPDYLKNVPADEDEVILGGTEHELLQRQRGATRYYFMFDESGVERFETVLMGATLTWLIVVIGIAAWLSTVITGRMVEPLTRLVTEVSELGDDRDNRVTVPAAGAADDEVTRLARAIAGYHERINRMLVREREFSSDVSHELRTPMMAIQGSAELLQRELEPAPKVGELLDRIQRGCSQMASLTEALLFLAREPASFDDMVEPVDLERAVHHQLSTVGELAQRKGIKLVVEKQGDAATVETIPAVINIVIGNILKNAIKHTDRDRVSVFVADHQVVIQDYGPGIERASQASLFDRFARGSKAVSDGSGIGLALVRRFCEQYGWKISLESQLDKGTRVSVEF